MEEGERVAPELFAFVKLQRMGVQVITRVLTPV